MFSILCKPSGRAPVSIFFRWLVLLIFALAFVPVEGQGVITAQPILTGTTTSNLKPAVRSSSENFRAQQGILASRQAALLANGATPAQVTAWSQQNAAALAAQNQRAQALALAGAANQAPENPVPRIPANASPALRQFLQSQGALAQSDARLHNQFVSGTAARGVAQGATLSDSPSAASNAGSTATQLQQARKSQYDQFKSQNAALLAQQQRRMQALASQPRGAEAMPPLMLPRKVTPQLVALLTFNYQLLQGRIQRENQYATATPAERDAALRAWDQQNAATLQQLQQQAFATSASASSRSVSAPAQTATQTNK